MSLNGREFGFDYLLQSIEAGVTYTQVRGINKEKEIYLSDMPADQYTFSLKYFIDKNGVTLGYLGINTLKQDRINAHTLERTDETPGYFTHNIFMTKKFSRSELRGFSFTTRVDNLTNRRYRKHASN